MWVCCFLRCIGGAVGLMVGRRWEYPRTLPRLYQQHIFICRLNSLFFMPETGVTLRSWYERSILVPSGSIFSLYTKRHVTSGRHARQNQINAGLKRDCILAASCHSVYRLKVLIRGCIRESWQHCHPEKLLGLAVEWLSKG